MPIGREFSLCRFFRIMGILMFFCFCTYVGKNTDDVTIRHRVPLVQITHSSTQLAIRSTELTGDDLRIYGIGVFDPYGIL